MRLMHEVMIARALDIDAANDPEGIVTWEVEDVVDHLSQTVDQPRAELLKLVEEWKAERDVVPVPSAGSKVRVIVRDASKRWSMFELGTVTRVITDYPKYDVEVQFPDRGDDWGDTRRFLFNRWDAIGVDDQEEKD